MAIVNGKRKDARTPAKRASEKRYKAKAEKRIHVSFFPPNHDLYNYASSRDGETAAAYIRRLIREDMERNS